MSAPPSITPGPPDDPGQDYAYLRQEGISHLQKLCGEVWTDYNEHDPGVTTLEQLCYALTELSYRASFPLKDLLIDAQSRKIELRRQALFDARSILPCNPLTEDDYRKLIADRVPAVANVWLRPLPPEEVQGIRGLYDIWLYARVNECCTDEQFQPDAVLRAVREVYCSHRNIGEDLHAVRFLEEVPATVVADVTIDDTHAPEAILAGLLFNLGKFLAPELHRRSLNQTLKGGLAPDAIFNGPLLLNGFIDDAQLQPKAQELPVRDLIDVMAGSQGVISVRGVQVRVGPGGKVYEPTAVIPVPGSEILVLQPALEKGGRIPIRLFRNGLRVKPQAERVRRELDRLWADWRQTYSLDAQYEEYFGVPEGNYRDVSQYVSIQNQFPNVYCINAYGLPADASALRRGQARQFKGYLLVFEQLLANFFSQLAHAKDLYSMDPALRQTYFYQYLSGSVPNVEPLLKKVPPGGTGISYEHGLPRIVASQDPVTERRNRFLDFLLALYGESLDMASICEWTWGEYGKLELGERLLQAKLALLHHLIESSSSRGRGIDYLEAPSRHNVEGMVIKSRIQLGMEVSIERSLTDSLDELSLQITEPEEGGLGRGALNRHADHIEESFALPSSGAEWGVGATQGMDRALRAQSVTEEFLLAAGDPDNFRVGSLPGESAVSVVCRTSPEGEWQLVGKYPDRQSALARVEILTSRMRELRRHLQQLHVVDHLLLRSARRGGAARFDYSFAATAVISTSVRLRDNPSYREFAREVIRANAPAHVQVDCLFLGPAGMSVFERLFWAWRSALRQQKEHRVVETSTALRDFLVEARAREVVQDRRVEEEEGE